MKTELRNKRHKELYIYGNYHRYYGYRIGKNEGDPRLQVLQREWFEGKDCLDVGCNDGYITVLIAQTYHCKSITGVDIDSDLIGKARRSLKRAAEEAVWNADSGDDGGECLRGEGLLQTVEFRTENFVKTPAQNGLYDTVLCLSVTKWIHLNWGDDGLIKFFSKILSILRPEGLLILEPQPWKSYASKRNVSEVARKNFREIQLRPEAFPELLIEKIGFKSSVELKVPSSNTGFNRPLFLYRK